MATMPACTGLAVRGETAGAGAAPFLSTLAIGNIMITKYHWTANTPRAHITNQRAMEVFRDVGIEGPVLADGIPHALMGDTVFSTSMAGEESGCVLTRGTHPARQCYSSDAVVCDGSQHPEPSRDPELSYEPSTVPGSRLPHVWVGDARHKFFTLDLAPMTRFTVLTGIAGEPWIAAAEKAGQEPGVPLETVMIGPGRKVTDLSYDWARVREVEEDGVLLVRPDKHIGCRSARLPADPARTLHDAMAAILGWSVAA